MALGMAAGWDSSGSLAVNHGVDVGMTRCRRAGWADLRMRFVAASDRAKPNLWIELRGL
jgi:hypothetical protein